MYYILDDQRKIIPTDALGWIDWFRKNPDRHVAQTQVGKCQVSTVFLGLDHNYGGTPPLLFETMIFGHWSNEEYQTRCSTWEEAEAQHAEAVARCYRDGVNQGRLF